MITGVCSELTGQTATIISANANTITLNIATDSGCTFATGGTASYPLSGTTQLSAFTNAAMQDAQLTPYELTNLQNFYASGGRDPAEYDEADCTGFTKYWTSSGGCNIYGSVHPVPDAVVEFNAAP